MPNTSSAKKSLRQTARRRAQNLRRKDAMSMVTKQLRKLAAAGKQEEAKALVSRAYKAIDKAAKRGVIKKNTAARKKSSLARLVAVK